MPRATLLWAGLLGLVYLGLAVRVIRARGQARTALGHGGDRTLERAIRAHGNFAEYVPFALLLLLLAELSGMAGWAAHAAGALLLAGRVSHALGIAQEPENFRFRVTGMAITFAVIASLSFTCLIGALR
ncbi:MAPEG family protein [Roseomonas sp. CCTCC AB2023176]|uniref:MAPEG family protein n=1 Tax=Roseomonas sp. CCTCC AB2023176 TaxID=3342640 RepID=UPI0035D55CA1